MSQAKTHAKDHTVNQTVLMMSMRRRPNRSASPPATTAPKNMPTKDNEIT